MRFAWQPRIGQEAMMDSHRPVSSTTPREDRGLWARLTFAAASRSTAVLPTVSQPEDTAEQEAERVADEAVSTPDEDGFAVAPRAGGELPEGLRAAFEARLGSDFRTVQVHADRRAAVLANSLQADAFTVGRDIYFNSGNYRPDTPAGRRLLAHELTHVVQQRGDARATSPGTPTHTRPTISAVPAGVMRRLRLTGTAGARSKVKTIMDAGLGPALEAVIDPGGNVTVRFSGAQGPPTPENQEFTTRLQAILNDAGLVTVGVTEGGMPLVGSYNLAQIDIDDMTALGIGQRGWDARAALLHELVEQREKQLSSTPYGSPTSGAHGAATTAELAVIGATMQSDTSSMTPNADGTVSGTRTTVFRYPDGTRWEMVVTVVGNNVTNVARRQLP